MAENELRKKKTRYKVIGMVQALEKKVLEIRIFAEGGGANQSGIWFAKPKLIVIDDVLSHALYTQPNTLIPIEIFDPSRYIRKASCTFGGLAESRINSLNKNKAKNCAAEVITSPMVKLAQIDAGPRARTV